MKLSMEKIKKNIEQKRKNNEKLLKSLKEKSIIYNSEKRKRNFLNSSNTFLNHKRKLTNNEINIDELSNSDSEEYNDSFINNNLFNNKAFTNLNFSRPQRFSLNISNKGSKKKLFIKNAELFSINKPRKIPNYSEFSNYNFSFYGDNSIKDINNDKNKGNGLLSNLNSTNTDSNNQESYFNFDTKKKNPELNEKNKDNSLFLPNSSFENTNDKSLFTSNIDGKNKTEIKKDEKENVSDNLFCDKIKLNSKIDEGKKLFSNETKEENKDLKLSSKEEETKNESNNINNKNVISNPEPIPLSPKNKKLFNAEAESPNINKLFNEEKEKKENKENKESINLFSPINNNEKENKENKDKDNNINKEGLLKNTIFNSNNPINEKKEEKETISLFKLKELQEKDAKEEEEKRIKQNSNLENSNNKKESLNFGYNKNEKKENKESIKPNFSLFEKKNEEKVPKNNKENNNIEENKQTFIPNSQGSLVNESNPFIKAQTTSTNLPNIFSAKSLTSPNKNQNYQENSLNPGNKFNIFTQNIKNNETKPFFFNIGNSNQNNQNFGDIEMSSQMKSRDNFNNVSNNLDKTGNNNTSFNDTNIFGASIQNNSFFKSGNMSNIFSQNSSNLFNNQHNSFLGMSNSFANGPVFNFGKK